MPTRSLAQEVALEELRERANAAAALPDQRPARTYIDFPRPRPLAEWIGAGQTLEGFAANGLALPPRVLESLGKPGPTEYVVIGETRYSDGRWYLDFGMNPAWIEHNTDNRFLPGQRYPTPVCPDCEATGGDHQKITIPDPDGGRPMTVKCPRDTVRSSRR